MHRDLASPFMRDHKSELVDPIKAADELIDYAISLRQEAWQNPRKRLSQSAMMLLDALDDPKQGLDVIYSTFKRYAPRRADVDSMIDKMEKESTTDTQVETGQDFKEVS